MLQTDDRFVVLGVSKEGESCREPTKKEDLKLKMKRKPGTVGAA
jgi:hypothetical protein